MYNKLLGHEIYEVIGSANLISYDIREWAGIDGGAELIRTGVSLDGQRGRWAYQKANL